MIRKFRILSRLRSWVWAALQAVASASTTVADLNEMVSVLMPIGGFDFSAFWGRVVLKESEWNRERSGWKWRMKGAGL